MKLVEKLNDFWEFVRDNPKSILEMYKRDASITLTMSRTPLTKGSMEVDYRFKVTTHGGHVWYMSEGRFSIACGVHATTSQSGVRDAYADSFLPDTNFILGRFFHHFQHFPDLPTLKAISLKTLNSS